MPSSRYLLMKQRLRTLCNLSVTSVCSQRYHKVLVTSVTAMWERASWLFITFVYRTRCRKMRTSLDRTIVKYYFWHSHNRTAFTTLTTVCSLDLSWTEACIKPIFACLNVCHIPSTFVLSFFYEQQWVCRSLYQVNLCMSYNVCLTLSTFVLSFSFSWATMRYYYQSSAECSIRCSWSEVSCGKKKKFLLVWKISRDKVSTFRGF